ncbi:hypothetical protein ACH4S9_14205 [Streptomyces sp. NPDC021225]
MPPGPATPAPVGTVAAPRAAGADGVDASVRAREAASPGYRRRLA